MIAERAIENPFPGLRPFEQEESFLFFGRDEQTDELLERLEQRRFLAVVGTSGCGKSSLVRAGLLPALHRGYMAAAGSRWRIGILRPGSDPIGNLTQALAGVAGMDAAALLPTVERSSLGVVEAVRKIGLAPAENLLLVADQFEEIFRFRHTADPATAGERAAAFVKLLLAAAEDTEFRIYVVLTMRSDFLGDCAQFRGLPEALNTAQYLVPRLTREQLREAIEGPLGVAGGEAAPRLVQRLLNDMGEDSDQLPVLQHALMRTWDKARAAGLQRADIEHYEACGAMADALNLHANEIFESLEPAAQEIAKRLFQRITEKGSARRDVRRPAPLAEIRAVADAPEANAIAVIDAFRGVGRAFLVPPAEVALHPDSVIDISHEALIRVWRRLRTWVEEEGVSAELYQRLARSAELHEQAQEALWRDPGLQVALDWRRDRKPNEAWANRYRPGFGRAMAFLEASRIPRDRWRKIRAASLVLLAVLSVAGIVGAALARGFSEPVVAAEAATSEIARAPMEDGDSLTRLETLRAPVAALDEKFSSIPGRLVGFIFRARYYDTRRAYLEALHQTLIFDARQKLVLRLLALPAAPDPNSSYDHAYNSLKAYLVTTARPEHYSSIPLAAFLTDVWAEGQYRGAEQTELARRQFEFYVRELDLGRRPRHRVNDEAVRKARAYLAQFSGDEAVYQSLLTAANRATPAASFNGRPALAGIVPVPGAFTREGQASFRKSLQELERYQSGEQWVLASSAQVQTDTRKLARALSSRYCEDYAAAWQRTVGAVAVPRFASMEDARDRLRMLGGRESPMRSFFEFVAGNANRDCASGERFFPPFAKANELWAPYGAALTALAAAVERADQPLVQQSTVAVKEAALQVVSGLPVDKAGRTEVQIGKLLEAPAGLANSLVRAATPESVAERTREFCDEFNGSSATSKFPFVPGAKEEASPEELERLFRKPNGLLWSFYDTNLKGLLRRQGASFVTVDKGSPLSPSFVSFFNRAAAVSDALYAGGSRTLRVPFRLRLLPSSYESVMVMIDGQEAALGNESAAAEFVWPGKSSDGQIISGRVSVARVSGFWSMFRLSALADRWQEQGGGYVLEWQRNAGAASKAEQFKAPSEYVRLELDMAGAPPIFRAGFLGSLNCVADRPATAY